MGFLEAARFAPEAAAALDPNEVMACPLFLAARLALDAMPAGID